jgi:hypothetical protein
MSEPFTTGLADTEEEQQEMDMVDNDKFIEEAVEACIGLGLTEDEAELMVNDMF